MTKIALILAGICVALPALAQPRDRTAMLTLGTGIYVDARLAALPYDVISGRAQTRSAGHV
ncbi:hypothetical protein [Sabulicella glaciei]|uniref:Uncharacterized protein n=1 Tax=Sabulicella glaciei TaxID=2984948 RepID=A0ABT3NV79_9PROT|nr:hypothetical protein [Roseococcus sp. MDT2-1-1]MCW8086054.1 hypothetical protein [Roseococcus sp. MDT2-1-1]